MSLHIFNSFYFSVFFSFSEGSIIIFTFFNLRKQATGPHTWEANVSKLRSVIIRHNKLEARESSVWLDDSKCKSSLLETTCPPPGLHLKFLWGVFLPMEPAQAHGHEPHFLLIINLLADKYLLGIIRFTVCPILHIPPDISEILQWPLSRKNWFFMRTWPDGRAKEPGRIVILISQVLPFLVKPPRTQAFLKFN